MSAVSPKPPPSWQVEHRGPLLRFAHTLSRGERVDGLGQMVDDGAILSYSRENNDMVVYANDRNQSGVQQRLQAAVQRATGGGRVRQFLGKLSHILIPPDLKKACSSEYLPFRAWSVGSTVCAGAVTVMTNAVTLDALKIAFGTGTNYALSMTANSVITGLASIGGSFLAQKGDADPKKCYMISSLVGVANAITSLALFATVPHAYPFIVATTALTGALGGVLGGAAWVNIFNHIAKGNSKGVVQSRNSNQDLIANNLLGPVVAFGISKGAALMGVNPYIATVGICGPIMAFCLMQAARTLRLERLDRQGLERVVDRYLSTGQIEPPKPRTMWQLIKGVFVSENRSSSPNIHFVDDLDSVVSQDRPPAGALSVFDEFERDNYLLSARDGQVDIAFKKDAGLEDAIQAYMHARCVERGTGNHDLMAALRQRYGDSAESALVTLVHRVLPKGAPTQLAGQLSDSGWNASPANLGIHPIEAAKRRQQEPPGATSASWNSFLHLVDAHEPDQINALLAALAQPHVEQPRLPLEMPAQPAPQHEVPPQNLEPERKQA